MGKKNQYRASGTRVRINKANVDKVGKLTDFAFTVRQ